MYIDPGTGSMLFTILLGTLGAATYKFKDTLVRMKFRLSSGKTDDSYLKTEKYTIFSDDKRYWNVFEPICDEFEKRGVQLLYLTSSKDDPAFLKDYEHVRCEFLGEGNKAFARLNSMHADILLSTTPSLDVFYWKRSPGVKYYIHIPHAASDLTLYRMFGIDYYDAVLTSGDFQKEQIRALESIRGIPQKEITKVGLTFLDEMKKRLTQTEKDKISSESVSFSSEDRKINVLLAPSWGPNAIFSVYGSRVIDALLDTGYHIIIRPHPQSFKSEAALLDPIMKKYPDSDRIEWNRDNDNFDVLRRSDILISDYSGVIFDFSLVFDKPVIYTESEFDDAPFDACWLEDEPWTFKVLPLIGKKLTETNIDSIKDLIDECINDSRYNSGRKLAREQSWAYPGEGAVRTADYLINKHAELTDRVGGKGA